MVLTEIEDAAKMLGDVLRWLPGLLLVRGPIPLPSHQILHSTGGDALVQQAIHVVHLARSAPCGRWGT